MKKSVLWVTRTALSLALLTVAQAMLKALGQYVLGSTVNLILISTAVLFGISEGITVAILSPILAFLLGFGPALPQIVPVVILGNISIVLVWYLITKKNEVKQTIRMGIAAALGAILKFLVLWIGVTKIVIPVFKLNEAASTMLSVAFSYPQLITAGIAGLVAILILPKLLKVVKKE